MLEENKRTLTKKREACYHKIYTYEQRREAIRKKYPASLIFPYGHPPGYNEAVKRINLKIKLWKRQIKRIDMINAKITALANAVALFTGYTVKGSNYSQLEGMRLAKSLFYKYGLENKLEGKDLREYVGAKRINQPTDYRTQFTRSFQSNPQNKQQWLNFCEYMRNIPVTPEVVGHVIFHKKSSH